MACILDASQHLLRLLNGLEDQRFDHLFKFLPCQTTREADVLLIAFDKGRESDGRCGRESLFHNPTLTPNMLITRLRIKSKTNAMFFVASTVKMVVESLVEVVTATFRQPH
jgi:hypothetical protein